MTNSKIVTVKNNSLSTKRKITISHIYNTAISKSQSASSYDIFKTVFAFALQCIL